MNKIKFSEFFQHTLDAYVLNGNERRRKKIQPDCPPFTMQTIIWQYEQLFHTHFTGKYCVCWIAGGNISEQGRKNATKSGSGDSGSNIIRNKMRKTERR